MDAVHKSCLRPCGALSLVTCVKRVSWGKGGRESEREREREKLTNKKKERKQERKKERKNDTQDIDFKGRPTYIYTHTCKEYVQVRT